MRQLPRLLLFLAALLPALPAAAQTATLVTDLQTLREPGTFFGGSLFFIGCTHDASCELWKSDGTVAGTALVLDIVPGDLGSQALSGRGALARFPGERRHRHGRGPDRRHRLFLVLQPR